MSSNLIKGVRTYMDKENVRTIDSEQNPLFRPLSTISERQFVSQSQDFGEEDDFEDIEPDFEAMDEELSPEEFLMQEKENFIKEAQRLVLQAREEAEQIVTLAHAEAEQLKADAIKEGRKIGYQDGISQASEEITREKEKLKKDRQEFETEYQKALKNMEPDMAQILIGLVKNLTGVILDSGNGVIMHLIGRSLGRIARNNEFILHVSREDYVTVDKKKPFLQKIVGPEKKIEIYEEEELSKNQCRIETDDQILDCSLDVQMENLFENLILLSRT